MGWFIGLAIGLCDVVGLMIREVRFWLRQKLLGD